MTLNFSKRMGALLGAILLASVACNDKTTTNVITQVPGTIAGTVKNSSGKAVAGVVVTPSPATVPATATDASGKYSLDVAPGSYTLAFTGDNLEPATSASTTVASGQTVTVDQTMAASTLKVTVNVPAALKSGGAAGFDTTVPVTATVMQGATDVTAASTITWTVLSYDGLAAPPTAATPEPATGASTSFAIPAFENVRVGANDWLNARYKTAGTAAEFEYIQAPERDQLLSLGVQQVRAMSYMVKATVTNSGRTVTGSAVIAPANITTGENTLPLGMMVVGNAPSTLESYSWTLGFLPMSATAAEFQDASTQLHAATTKNPSFIPTTAGVYKLQNGGDEPIYFRASTWHGSGTSDTAEGPDGVACADCHTGDYSLSGKFKAWNASAHGNVNWKDPTATQMSLFRFGVDGGEGSHYGESCIQCHVVGYNKVPSAVNNGFDDVMGEWTWQTPPETFTTPEPFDALPAALKHRGAIQCENCHGPLEPTDHSQPEGLPALFALPVSPIPSISSGVCMNCHDALSNHDRGTLWAASLHANTALAMEEASVEGNPAKWSSGSPSGVANCGRCHSGEGFVLYKSQLTSTKASNCAVALNLTEEQRAGYLRYKDSGNVCQNIGSGTDFAQVNAYYASQGLTEASAHSTTCVTCHSPHSTKLTLTGDTPETAGFFKVKNAGAGALCIVCHNSRTGAVRQGDNTLADWSSPHVSSQGDMWAGRNAYFVDNLVSGQAPGEVPNLAVHAKYLADACVDCHMKIVPADIKAQYKPAGTNHTFKSSAQVCTSCHEAGFGELIQEGIQERMDNLNAAISRVLSAKMLKAGFYNAKRTNVDTKASETTGQVFTSSMVQSIQLDPATTRGGAVFVKLNAANGSVKYKISLGDVMDPTTTTAKLFTVNDGGPTQTVGKAFYNLMYVTNDKSLGAHNPAFAKQVLDNATNALTGLSIP